MPTDPPPAAAPARPLWPRRPDWSRIAHDASRANWSLTNARAALLCLPVIAGCVFGGIIGGSHAWGVLSAAGAVSVGFGAFQRLGDGRFWPMLLTLSGIAVGTFVGTVSGKIGWGCLVAVAAIAGYGFGAMTTLGYAAWWIGLQWMIALLVYGAHPAGPAPASRDALAVFAGGACQLLALTAIRPLTHRWFRRQDQPPFDVDGSLRAEFASRLRPGSADGRYALRMAAGIALAVAVNHVWGLPNGYWTPMTVAILLKPDVHETAVRGWNRFLGTLAGAGLTTLLVAYLRPDATALGLLLLLAVWACYTLQRVNYAFFATFITIYVVLLLSILGLPGRAVAEHRIMATVVGAAIALAVHVPLRRAKVPG